MALQLNLYHEVQKQARQRSRDPLKIGVFVLMLIALCLVAYYFWCMQAAYSVKSELSRLQDEWGRIDEKQKAARVRVDELNQTLKVANSFATRIDGRIYWATMLEKIMRVVPPEVQITQLLGTLANDGSRKVTISLAGVAAGQMPRAVAEQLRTGLYNKFSADYSHTASVFKSLEDGVETVFYKGGNWPTAVFTIELSFDTKNPGDAARKDPQPYQRKK